MRPIDTRSAATFIEDLGRGPWLLAARGTIQPVHTREQSIAFLKAYRDPQVLLGPLKETVIGKPGANDLQFARYIAVELPISAKDAIDPHPNSPERKTMQHTAPHLLMASKTHCVAAWSMFLPEYNRPKEVEASLAAFAEWFGVANKCTCTPLLFSMPVPDLGNGWTWHHQRGKGQAIHHSKIMQAESIEKPADTSLDARGRKLATVLQDYKVSAKVTGAMTGPVITLFHVEPARGVKVSAVEQVARDVARAMKCETARVVEMPGTGAIGIELPNKDREIVQLQELLDARAFKTSKAALALALGKTIDGKPVVADLAAAPHLLMGGTTGSGKSVTLKTMIQSMICRLPPAKVRFLMVDAKTDLAAYDALPHMLAPVIGDMGKVARVLEWGVAEMKRRYAAMKKAGAVDLAEYNGETHEPMVRLVIIIDELAELMSKENAATVSPPMQRLAQMGRACGIHIIAGTQRPDATVIGGTIKANFPSRIALKTSPGPDSNIILGEPGADALLGKGDMLWLDGGGKITRVHGAFIDQKDVKAEVRRQREKHGEPKYREDILALLADDGDDAAAGTAFAREAKPARPKLSATVMKYAAALQEIFSPGGQPVMGVEVRRALTSRGLSWGRPVYDAADALRIERGDRNGVAESKPWIPPSEWPDSFAIQASW